MLATASFALGILLAAIVLHFTRRHEPGTGRLVPSIIWIAFAAGSILGFGE